MYELYLAHHGILGMKWGVRRFQNKDGSWTPAGEKRYGAGGNDILSGRKSPRHKPSNARKLAKQRAANLEKARQAKADKKQFEEEKKNALEKGSAADILKFKGQLSNTELQTAVNRINLEQQLATIAQKDVKTGWDKANSVMDKVGKLTDYSNKAINAYNTIAKINNSFNSNKMQVIDGVGKKAVEKASQYEKLIKTGSAEQVLAAVKSGRLTKSEREEAINRLNSEKILSNMVKEKHASASDSTKNSSSEKSKAEKASSAEKSKTEKKENTSEKSKTASKNSEKQSAPEVDIFEPKAGKNYSTGASDKERQASVDDRVNRAQEWAAKKANENRKFYEASWTDVEDSSFTSSGRNYASNALFMTLPAGQVIPLLPEHK